MLLSAAAEAHPLDTLAPGEWYEVPNSHLADSGLIPDPVPPGSPSAVMYAWSGGAYDSKRDRLMVWGGGHGDYAGNEIYAFDVASLAWMRIWGPSPYDAMVAQYGSSCTETYSDGNPVARHTYDSLQYLPGLDRFWIQGGSLTCGSGGSGKDTWTFDLLLDKWERRADVPIYPSLEHVSGYDPSSGHVFLALPDYDFLEYDPQNDSYTVLDKNGGVGGGKTAALDFTRRKLIAVGTGTEGDLGDVVTYDLDAPYARTKLSTTGATEILTHRYPGLEYEPNLDRVVAWATTPPDDRMYNTGSAQHPPENADVYTMDMDTLVWTKHLPAASNTAVPTGSVSAGTYGRFRYMPSKNAFVLVNSIYEDVFFYKLSPGDGSPAPSDTTPPAAPTNLRVL